MVIEMVESGIVCLMDTLLLYLFIGLFSLKRDLNKLNRILPFIILIVIHIICALFQLQASHLKIPTLFLLDILFCFVQFQDKWYKYAVNTGLFYILYAMVEAFFFSIFSLLNYHDAAQVLPSYEPSLFVITIITRLVILLVVLLIKNLMGRSVQQKQWHIFLLMPILTVGFAWFIYPRYWGMKSPEIDKLLTYVGVFLVVQNVFVFFYIISLQSSTKQYVEMKAAFDRQKQYFTTITTIQKAVRKMAHDIRHHFIYLMSALEKEDIPKAKDYIIKLDENLENMIPLNVTGHYDVDALLHAKARIAEKLDIHIRVEGILPPEIMISPIDLSVLLGNSLDNAIEATSRVNNNKEITVSFGYNASRLNFTISNPYTGQIRRKLDGHFISQKPNGGLGIEIMNQVVKKYDGALLTDIMDDKFTLTAMLQTQQTENPCLYSENVMLENKT